MNEQESISNNENDSVGQAEKSVWPRILYMILFAIAFGIGESVMYLVAIANLVYFVIKKEIHKGLQQIGDSLSIYLQQIARYLTFNSEYLPFPFNDWPSSSVSRTRDSH